MRDLHDARDLLPVLYSIRFHAAAHVHPAAASSATAVPAVATPDLSDRLPYVVLVKSAGEKERMRQLFRNQFPGK